MANFHDLPPETIDEISQHLDTQTAQNLCLTCRALVIPCQKSIFSRVSIVHLGHMRRLKGLLDANPTISTFVRELTLYNTEGSKKGLVTLLNKLSNLHTLTFSPMNAGHSKWLDLEPKLEKALIDLFQRCERLDTLIFDYFTLDPRILRGANGVHNLRKLGLFCEARCNDHPNALSSWDAPSRAHQLYHLAIRYCSGGYGTLQESALDPVVKAFSLSKLRTLEIQCEGRVDLSRIFSECASTLKHLIMNLTLSEHKPFIIPNLSSLHSLETLKFQVDSSDMDEAIALLDSIPVENNIKRIEMQAHDYDYDADFNSDGESDDENEGHRDNEDEGYRDESYSDGEGALQEEEQEPRRLDLSKLVPFFIRFSRRLQNQNNPIVHLYFPNSKPVSSIPWPNELVESKFRMYGTRMQNNDLVYAWDY